MAGLTRPASRAALALVVGALGLAVAPIEATAQRCGRPGVVELSRLWIRPEVPRGAGDAGAQLRGWNDGRTARPGRDATRHGFLSAPWLLPVGDDEPLAFRLDEAFSAGPLLPRTLDAVGLQARHPLTEATDLVGGDLRYFHRLRAELWGALRPYCATVWAEAIDERTAGSLLGAGRDEARWAPRTSINARWQPTPTTAVTLGARWDALRVADAGLSAWDRPSAGRDHLADQTVVIATLRHQLAPRLELSAVYDLTLDRDDWNARGGLATPGHLNLDNYVGWGNHPFTRRHRSRRQRADLSASGFADGVLVGSDAHTLTLGVQVEHLADDEDETRNGGFTFVDILPSDASGAPVDRFDEAERASWELYASDRGDELHAKVRQLATALYAEDRVELGDAVAMSLGVRAERHVGGFTDAPAQWQTWTLSPRLAVDAGLGATRATSLYLRAGRHHQQLTPSFYRRARSGAAYSPLEYWDWTGEPLATPPSIGDPAWRLDRTFEPVLGEVDPDVRHPWVDRLVVGARHVADERVEVGVRYELRRFGDLLGLVDRRFAEGAYVERETLLGDAPADRFRYYELPAGERPAYQIGNPAGARRRYHGLRLDVDAAVTRWLTVRGDVELAWDRGNLDSAYGLSEEWRDPSGSVNATGNMADQERVRAHAELAADLPGRVRAWLDYGFTSGAYHSRLLRVQPTSGPRIFVYDLAGRGGYRYPARHVVDLRVARALPLPGPGRWLGSVDVRNLLAADTVTGFRETTSYFRAVRSVERPFEIILGVRYAY